MVFFCFFFIWVFFHDHSRITGLQGKGGGISLTTHYHFHPLHRCLDISWAITAESSPLHMAGSRKSLTTKSLTTKLRTLNNPFASCSFINFDFLLPHTAHFDGNIGLPFLVFNIFESTFSVSFLPFKQYVSMFYN